MIAAAPTLWTPAGRCMMVKAYVLIVTNPGATRRVAEALAGIAGINVVHEVMGPYDIVAELVTDSLTDIPPILADRIRTIEGIQSTTSLVAFPD
jgi:DNA-binding Lrp family transcriptional regulator